MTEAQLFHCPSCGAPLDLQEARRTIHCRYCNNVVIVPQALRDHESQIEGLGDITLLAMNEKKIEAIRRLRELTGWSLKQTKDVVDAMQRGEALASLTGSVHVESHAAAVDQVELMDLVQRGRKIEAIKLLREATGLGLKDAKDVVEALERGDSLAAANEMLEGMLGESNSGQADPQVFSLGTIDSRQARRAIAAVGVGTSILSLAIICVILTAVIVPVFFALAADNGPLAPWWSQVNPFSTAVVDLRIQGEGIAPGQFNDPRTITVDGEGNLFVGDFDTGRLQSFDSQGKFRWVVNLGDDVIIEALDVSPGGVLFLAAGGDIRRFQTSDGRELEPLPRQNEQAYSFDDLSFGMDGRLAVVANGEDLMVFNPDLQVVVLVPEAVSSVTADSELDCDVAMDGLGNIYLLGHFNHKVLHYSPEGRFLDQFGGETTDEADGKFRAPSEIAIDPQGRVYVSDIFGVHVFDGNGRFLHKFKLFQYAFGMDFDLENRMVIASNEPQILRLVLRK